MTDRVEMVCNDCGKIFTLSNIYFKQRKNNPNKIWRCKECTSKYKSKVNKDRWNGYTDEDRNNISNKQSQTQSAYWQRTSKDDRIIRLDKFIKAGKNYWDTMDDEQRKIIGKMHSDWYNSLSDEEKIEHAKKSNQWYQDLSEYEKYIWAERASDRWKALSEEEKERRANLLIENNKKWLDGLDDDEKKNHYEQNANFLRKFWKNVTDDQKLSWFYLNNKAITESSIVQEKKSLSEIEFINYLNIYKIPYKYQYMNLTYPDDFYKIFDNGRSPYHKWDFIVNTTSADILVDIDGSEHIIPEGQFITKDGIDVGKNIKENDSKRPYQTDGLSAYIILAYDDQIRNDTIVYNITDNRFIIFSEFINYLCAMNMSNDELNKIMREVGNNG